MEKAIRIEWRDVVVFADSPEEAVAIIEGLRRRAEAEALLPADRPDMPAQRLLRGLLAIQEAGRAGLRSAPLAAALGVVPKALSSTSQGWRTLLAGFGYELEDVVQVAPLPGAINGWFPGPRLPEVIRRLEEQLGQGPPPALARKDAPDPAEGDRKAGKEPDGPPAEPGPEVRPGKAQKPTKRVRGAGARRQRRG